MAKSKAYYAAEYALCERLPKLLAESFEACRISKMRHDTSEIRISDKKIGMIDQSWDSSSEMR